MGITRAVSILAPSDKITVYFATTNTRADKILSWGFREGIRIRVTDDASQPGVYDTAESCIEITLPESIIAKYEWQLFFTRYLGDSSVPVQMPREWKIPTEILNRYPKVRLD